MGRNVNGSLNLTFLLRRIFPLRCRNRAMGETVKSFAHCYHNLEQHSSTAGCRNMAQNSLHKYFHTIGTGEVVAFFRPVPSQRTAPTRWPLSRLNLNLGLAQASRASLGVGL